VSYIVFTESDVYGMERFPRDTMKEALDTIRRLYQAADGDGVERKIGLLVNPWGPGEEEAE
jgi:hypothetical protein